MPIKAIRIEFGGLCLIVHQTRAEPRGIFVLMPALQDTGMVHCPFVVSDKKYSNAPTNKPVLRSLESQRVVNMRDLGEVDGPVVAGNFAKISYYARFIPGNTTHAVRPVDDRWLTGVADGDVLAARIELPGSAHIIRQGTSARLLAPGETNAVDLTGRVTFEFMLKSNVTLNTINIAGAIFKPDPVTGLLELGLLNVRPVDLSFKKREHFPNTPVPHIKSYYRLLKGWRPDERAPDLIIPMYQGGAPDDETEIPCSQATLDSWPPPETRFIDPYNCTIGEGCPQSNPAC